MTSDDTDPGEAPEAPGRYVLPESHAEIREGRHVVDPDAGHLTPPPEGALQTLEAALSLREQHRTFQEFINDPCYRPIRARLVEIESWLECEIRHRLEYDRLLDRFIQVHDLLPRPGGHH